MLRSRQRCPTRLMYCHLGPSHHRCHIEDGSRRDHPDCLVVPSEGLSSSDESVVVDEVVISQALSPRSDRSRLHLLSFER
jgi:hypothetical protein